MEKAIKVLIAGGGPAGIATALSLRKRGISCMIVEPENLEINKVGETISPNAYALMVKSGIENLLNDPAHLPSYGNSFLWGSNSVAETHFISQTYQHGWHVDRLRLEQQLRMHAVAAGVDYMQGCRVIRCKRHSGGWNVAVQNGNHIHDIFCEFLVDATGRSSRVARVMGLQRNRLDLLVGISSLIITNGGLGNNRTFIEASECGWWYAAPLTGNRVSLAFMTDSDLVEKRMLDYDYFLQKAKQTNLISSVLTSVAQASAKLVQLHAASTSILQKCVEASWLAVGDAACAFDPISSYGITSALEGGYYAGHSIADTLSGMKESLSVYDAILSQVFQVYRKMHVQQYMMEQRWSYSPFWSRRIVA
jgi:flavin-dependent dehydrogenase